MYQFSSLINPSLTETNVQTSRFSSAAWFNFVQRQVVMIAGAGGIGSWLAFMISRLGVRHISLVDDDYVERVNLAGQMFRSRDIGELKVVATNDVIKEFSEYSNVSLHTDRVGDNTDLPLITMCGFDNMVARQSTFRAYKRKLQSMERSGEDLSKALLIDGRLSAENLQVFCLPGNEEYYLEEYERKWLFDDSEAESVVCSYKQTSYCANLIASLMTNVFVNWCTNQCNPVIERAVPFMTEYEAEQMYLKVEV